jgi:hypothetical protein
MNTTDNIAPATPIESLMATSMQKTAAASAISSLAGTPASADRSIASDLIVSTRHASVDNAIADTRDAKVHNNNARWLDGAGTVPYAEVKVLTASDKTIALAR